MVLRRASGLIALFCLCAPALAAPQTKTLPESGIWLDVPFVQQSKNGCGSASIAMLLQYWAAKQGRLANAASDAGQIQRQLYSEKAHGILASQMQRYFQQQGFRTFAFRGHWDDLYLQIAKGRPLIVAVKSEGDDRHFVVVAGLDPVQGLIMLNDPARRKLFPQDRASFERQWTAAGNWTLLALPQAEPR